MKTTAKNKITAQEIQDRIYRKMPASKKVHLASGFFKFARELNKYFFQNGARRIAASRRRSA